MARKVKTVTAVKGDTSADRRLLAGVSAVTSPPSPLTDASLGVAMSRNEFIHLLLEITGGDAAQIRPWWYSTISGRWHQGNSFNVNANDIRSIEPQGLDRVYLEVTSYTGVPAGELNAWVALVVAVNEK